MNIFYFSSDLFVNVLAVSIVSLLENNKDENEINFYNSKGLDLPKRCKSCRDKNSGKYIVAYTQKKPENLVFSVLFSFVSCLPLQNIIQSLL